MANVYDPNIYHMSEALHNLGLKFMPEEDEETLSLGSYGYWNALFAQYMSNGIRIAQENANEMFYNRARLPKNVLAFAIANDIEDINAVPAKMPIQLWIPEDKLEALIEEHDPTNKTSMVFDTMLPFYIGDYEFHLDYNLTVTKRGIVGGYTYAGKYETSINNPISDIESPFIDTPYKMQKGGKTYICFSLDVHQVYKTKIPYKLISSNPIENKSYQFSFEHQLSDFGVIVTEEVDSTKESTILTPVFSGAPLNDVKNYCNYTLIDDSTIRVLFDQYSYMPKINADIETTVQTTDGEAGNITYTDPVAVTLKDTDNYTYLSTQVLIYPQGKAEGGKNSRGTDELRKLLPQQALSRGNITNNADLNNFFTKYNTKSNRLVFQKKIHNQMERRYYGYLLNKDSDDNVTPTNTIDLTMKISDLLNDDSGNITRHYSLSGHTVTTVIFTFEAGVTIGMVRGISTMSNGDFVKIVDQDNGNVEYVYSDRAELILHPEQKLSERPDLVNNHLAVLKDKEVEGEIDISDMATERAALEEMTIEEYYETYGFIYTLPYKTSINSDGPFSSFYINIMDEIYRINYVNGNETAPTEMILTYGTWSRPYTSTTSESGLSQYDLLITVTQAVDADKKLLEEIDSLDIQLPAYTVWETYNTENGEVQNNVTYTDIAEVILARLLSTADSISVTDNTSNTAIQLPDAEHQVLYYVVANKSATAKESYTLVFETETAAIDQYATYLEDETFLHVRVMDSNGRTLQIYDALDEGDDGEDSSEETVEDFVNTKDYTVTHLSPANGNPINEDYTSLIDALNKSVKQYYSIAPVTNYTLIQHVIGSTIEQSDIKLYDSEVDSIDNNLCFIQIKMPYGIMNLRSNMNTVADQVAKIPTQYGYQYQVLDKYGYVQADYSTYTLDWEQSETVQGNGLSVIDDYTEYDKDELKVNGDSSPEALIYEKLKVIIYVNGEPSKAYYFDSLYKCIRFMLNQTENCKLFYVNDLDASSENTGESGSFTYYQDDLIWEYNYKNNPTPIVRFIIVGDAIYDNADESKTRNTIKVQEYTSEAIADNTLEDICTTTGLEYTKVNGSVYNVYQFSKMTTILLSNFVHSSYMNNGLPMDNYKRNYTAKYMNDGISISTGSFYRLDDILAFYSNGTLAHNIMNKVETSGEATPIFDGYEFKEKYYLEYFNDEEVSNCYAVSSMAKLAKIYARVKNALQDMIDNEQLSKSDPDSYIEMQDQFGNTIDLDDTVEGHPIDDPDAEDEEYYPIWTYVKVVGTTEESTDKVTKIFSNLIEAIEYAQESLNSYKLYDAEGKLQFTVEESEQDFTIYALLLRNTVGNKFYIYKNQSSFETDEIRDLEKKDSLNKTSQSYEISITASGQEITATLLYAKDLSYDKANTYVDTDEITDKANLGINVVSSDYVSPEDVYVDNDLTEDQKKLIYGEEDPVTVNTPTEVDDNTEETDPITQAAINDALNERNNVTNSSLKATSNIPTLNLNTTGVVRVNGKKIIPRTGAILMLYKNNKPICYYRGDIYDYDISSGIFSYTFRFSPVTKDLLDENNNLLLERGNANDCTGCHYVGGADNGQTSQIYVPANCKARIYLLSKFTELKEGENPSGTLELVPNIISPDALGRLGFEGYIVTNVYEIKDGIDFFEDFSEIVNSTVTVNSVDISEEEGYQTYTIKSLPVIRKAYTNNNQKITEFLKALKSEKEIIDTSLNILEDQYQVDFKFFNTYGPAHIYYTSDTEGLNTEILDRVNISLTFAIKLRKASDDYTANYIKKDIKDAIEDLGEVDEFHLDNLAAQLYTKYQNSIYYIEFRGFNKYDSTRRHFFVDESVKVSDIPPEFININISIDGDNYTPDINIPAV